MEEVIVIDIDALKEQGVYVPTTIEEQSPDGGGFAETPEAEPVVPVEANVIKRRRRRKKVEVPIGPKEKHCPACLNGESLEEGEGTHVLLTVEHPYDPPEIFKDADVSVVAPPPKPVKTHTRPMAKELRLASSFAEKNLPKKIAEKAKLLGELARCEAEIQEYVRVIQALKGQAPVGMPNGSYQLPYAPQMPPQPQLPPMYAEYQQPAPQMPIVAPVKLMQAGGAGVAAGMLEVPNHWYEG
jgi:hypothetical protein